MNRNEAMVAVFSIVFAALPLAASAQSSAPNAPSGASVIVPPKVEQNAPTRTRSDSRADADARRCLEFATNLEVIACAEKYRSHRQGK
jgi:hypothetical protein